MNFNQALYRLIPALLEGHTRIRRDSDGLPDAVHYYLLYTSALIHGAADAALTLVLHNLGREARLYERHIFECWVRSKYFSENPDEASLALRATPFQEKQILDRLGYDKSRERYQELLETCKIVEKATPEARSYREPSIGQILSDEDATLYSFHYRVPSQVAHASFQGAGGVITDKGLQFNSQLEDPNLAISAITTYLLAFIDILVRHLGIDQGLARLPELREQWLRIQATLPHAGA